MLIENVLGWCISIQPLKNILDKKKKYSNLIRIARLYISYIISIFVLYSWCNHLVEYNKSLFFLRINYINSVLIFSNFLF